MSKLRAILTGVSLIGMAWFMFSLQVSNCGTIFLLMGLGFLGYAYVKYQYHAKLPQQVLDQHASTVSNQHYNRDQPAMFSEQSNQMFVPPALDE
ncbi:MAG: hypothetical protein H0U76_29690 [Ktedonobacteraceae bacterium]|nr:hypothetical protein [Ktedonobacteraceae bacterium]